MSYEDQLIREATGQNRDFEESHDCPKCELHFSDCICEPEPEETNESNETGDAQQGETFIIRCVNDSCLYWNNDVGWTDKSEASRFDSHERNTLNLPLEGKWIYATP